MLPAAHRASNAHLLCDDQLYLMLGLKCYTRLKPYVFVYLLRYAGLRRILNTDCTDKHFLTHYESHLLCDK